MSKIVWFGIIAFIILSLILIFEWIIYQRWKKRIPSSYYVRLFSYIYWSIVSITKLVFVFIVLFRKQVFFVVDGWFKPIYYFYLSWNYAFFFGLLVWGMGFVILYTIVYGFKKLTSLVSSKESDTSSGISRKMFLASSIGIFLDTTPFLATGLNFSGMYFGSNDFQIFRKEFAIKRLHKNFDGFRIVQISDLHIGFLIHEKYLLPTISMIKKLKPDCIVVTGDIIDNSNLYVNIAGWYFRKLQEIAPVYSVLGNHDHIDTVYPLVETLQKAGAIVLINDSIYIRRGKGILNIIGLDYPVLGMRSRNVRLQLSEKSFDQVYRSLRWKEEPKIVLNHHPSDFEYLQYKDIDLVLSGHTHGGQIILSDQRESPFSLASNFLKYYIDHYYENGVHLYVNRGLGHWFPLRIHCPPEITLIQLKEK